MLHARSIGNDRSPLQIAEPELVARLNASSAVGRLRNYAGRTIERPINGGLVRDAGDLVYPIVDEIPMLLYDEAIPLSQLEQA